MSVPQNWVNTTVSTARRASTLASGEVTVGDYGAIESSIPGALYPLGSDVQSTLIGRLRGSTHELFINTGYDVVEDDKVTDADSYVYFVRGIDAYKGHIVRILMERKRA